jgi:uncharacterized protein (DUF1499 family)
VVGLNRPRGWKAAGALLAVYLLLVAGITLAAPDEPWDAFPAGCPHESNCTRVADQNVRGEGLAPMRIAAARDDVQAALLEWLEEQPRTRILNSQDDFVHAVQRTVFFRFPDDFTFQLYCEGDETVIQVQSQSRLGTNDLGVNEKRVRDFYEDFDATALAPGNCAG